MTREAKIGSQGVAGWYEEPSHFEPSRKRLAFRTVWISDTHLGTPGCNAELLLDFLKSIECDNIFLVGEIIEIGWKPVVLMVLETIFMAVLALTAIWAGWV